MALLETIEGFGDLSDRNNIEDPTRKAIFLRSLRSGNELVSTVVAENGL